MKTIFIVLAIAFSMSSFAQEFNLYKVINKLEKFESKSGVGSHVKKGKTVSSNKSCYLHVENIDVWNSEYSVTGDYLILNINGKEVTTDLQGWDAKKVISLKHSSFAISALLTGMMLNISLKYSTT